MMAAIDQSLSVRRAMSGAVLTSRCADFDADFGLTLVIACLRKKVHEILPQRTESLCCLGHSNDKCVKKENEVIPIMTLPYIEPCAIAQT